MDIHIRNAQLDEYEAIEPIMKQAQQLHIEWRPDILNLPINRSLWNFYDFCE